MIMPSMPVAPGDHGDHLGSGQPDVVELAQQAVLPIGEAIGQLLDHVGDVLEFDQFHDVAVQTEHGVDVGHLPFGEGEAERELGDRCVFRRAGDLDAHGRHSGSDATGTVTGGSPAATRRNGSSRAHVESMNDAWESTR